MASDYKKKQSGVALFMVLMIVAIMSIVSLIYIHQNRLVMKEAAMLKEYSQRKMEVYSTRNQLVFMLTTTPAWSSNPANKGKTKYDLPDGFNLYGVPFSLNGIQITIQSESGLIPMIPFNDSAFDSLLKKYNVDTTRRHIIIDSIHDWMDIDDFIRLNGAEKLYYNTPGLPRNANIQTLSELIMIRGMDRELWDRIQSYLTMFGNTVNLRYAPEKVLDAIANQRQREAILKQRNNATKANEDSFLDETLSSQPGNRLRIKISSSGSLASYHESFILIRNLGQKQPFTIANMVSGK